MNSGFQKLAAFVGVAGAIALAPMAAQAGRVVNVASDATHAADAPLKSSGALRPKLEKSLAPFTWGMQPKEVFELLANQIDEQYSERIAKASENPARMESLEKERDKKKAALATKLVTFERGGLNGYETTAPGEFTYRNNEQAIEVPRVGGGARHLFFIRNKLWKVYDHVPLGPKSEMGESWDTAIENFSKDLGEKGKFVPAKTQSASYFGTMVTVPAHVLWSDGRTNVRLVDQTRREDTTAKWVAVAYEDLLTLGELRALRVNVETKASDSQVDKAGYKAPPVKTAKDKPKKK